MELPEVGFRYEPPQRVEPMRNEQHREPFRFDQTHEPRVEHVRNEHPHNELYRPSQNRRNMFGFHNNDRQNYERNDYDGQDRNAFDRNAPKRDRDVFDRGIDLEERNIRGDPNPRLAQGQDLRNQILEVIDQTLGLGHRRALRNPYSKPYPERIDREK